MGLDMYLNRKLYVSEHDFSKGAKNENLQISGAGFESVTPSKVDYIVENAGYWRKANAIHQWFVDNCQDGIDDCRDAYVSHDQLQELLNTVNEALNRLKLVPGVVQNGSTCSPATGGVFVPNLEAGLVVANPEVAADLLPTTGGFFFGGTNYDEYYVADLEETKKILEENLDEKYKHWSFEYHSSW